MKEYIDGETFKRIAIEPMLEEAETIRYSAELFLSTLGMRTGENRPGVKELIMSLSFVVEDVKLHLKNSETFIMSGSEAELIIGALNFVRNLHAGCPASRYVGLTRYLGTEPVALLEHGISAGQILDTQLIIV